MRTSEILWSIAVVAAVGVCTFHITCPSDMLHCWPNGNTIPTKFGIRICTEVAEGLSDILKACTHIGTCVVYDEAPDDHDERRIWNFQIIFESKPHIEDIIYIFWFQIKIYFSIHSIFRCDAMTVGGWLGLHAIGSIPHYNSVSIYANWRISSSLFAPSFLGKYFKCRLSAPSTHGTQTRTAHSPPLAYSTKLITQKNRK